jgi:hypothetical protein
MRLPDGVHPPFRLNSDIPDIARDETKTSDLLNMEFIIPVLGRFTLFQLQSP